jgi:PKD repeat protein
MPGRGWVALVVAALVPACSCGEGGGGADASPQGDGSAFTDGAVGPDSALPLIWIDFAITGCGEGTGPGPDAGPSDAGAEAPCRGSAPLDLEFVPVAPAPVDIYEWRFGDGSEPDGRASPDHTFVQPGTYDVALSAQGPGGTAGTTKVGIVVVEPGLLGATCDDGAQCASESCVCGGSSCAGFDAGFCTADCSDALPCAEGVCADLAPIVPDPEPWQANLCLVDCAAEAPCPDGSRCRELRRGDGAGWVSGCFAGDGLADLGESCVRPNGDRADELCASGSCLAEGLRGLCGAQCGPANPCPASSACATFETGARSCMARCDADSTCDSDPWLDCQAPGGAGDKAFTVDEAPSPGGYCAPKTCTGPGQCPQGQCIDGFCG